MDKIEEVLTRGVAEILPSKEALKKVLLSSRKLKIYIGADPTGPQLHLGHSTNFLILSQLQKLGHKIIILVGDFTGMIGDPSDKMALRKQLTRNEILENAKTYKDQVSKILNFEGDNPAEIKFNSKWLGKLTFLDGLNLMSNFTEQQLLERDMFQKRLKENKPLYAHEVVYPILQAYDSVAMDVDVEMGGSDQTFNMLMGRELMKEKRGKEKFVIVTELLINPKTGKKMMSKSEGNYIGLNDNPRDMYAKVLALPDKTIEPVFRMCTNVDLTQIDWNKNPLELKKELALEIVTMYHSKEIALKAQENFEITFQEQKPAFDKEIPIKNTLLSTLAPFTSKASLSEAKRLINQGGVDINGKRIGLSYKIKAGDKIKIGKKFFGIAVNN